MTAAVKTDDLMQRLIEVYNKVSEKDNENGSKLIELGEKLFNNKLYVAFAGHFSAGKSSMINKLLNEQILPTSPIPTSANLVLLENGPNEVVLYSKEKECIEITGDYSISQIKEYCKKGDEIERVHIKKPYENLTDNVVIMDTPGIDSTDAAHKLSTESMLHIADVIFYVTDYNHVQSEENLSFVKEMKEKGKMIFLIVNQIDKHNENEVPFFEFKRQIEASFEEVGLHNDDVFFTTLMNDDHQHNQLSEIKEIIQTIVTDKERFIDKNIKSSIYQLIDDHIEAYTEQLQLSDLDKDQIKTTLDQFVQNKRLVTDKLSEVENSIKEIATDMSDSVAGLLDSANIIPYETREKAASFIQAMDPSFKVGFLFSKSKTEQEREKRRSELFHDLSKNIETQITWHFTPLFKEYIQKYEIHDGEVLEGVQSFSIEITESVLTNALKPGASYNNQYVLTYSSDVSELIKKHSKKEAMKIFEKIMDLIKSDRQETIDKLSQELNRLDKEIATYEDILGKFDRLELHKTNLTALLNSPIKELSNVEKWLTDNKLYQHRQLESLDLEAPVKTEEKQTLTDSAKAANNNIGNKDHFIQMTLDATKRLKAVRGFKQFTDSIESKAESYLNRSFTVALFGAFSAGKSSFANALIGGKVLPSSPTPTTATINKIAPTTSTKQHGLVEVKLKAEELLVKEVMESIPSLKGNGTTLDALTNSLNGLEGKDQNEKDQIKKYRNALKDYKQLSLEGLQITATTDTFKDFVAKEEKACLVEEVVVYYDCPITKAGITLVDTPGADSLHKRHTDVAFQYIKKADAILYVTYYNHPFSKGDREFLRQLGRVKDSFTMDKMFFIINAIDLAKDNEEIELVKDYIRDQLIQQEIRNIRLYGLSSLNILSNKLESEVDYKIFKEQFDYFIKEELTNTTIIAIKEDLKRSSERLQSIIETAEKDEVEKERNKQKLLKEKQQVIHELSKLSNSHIQDHLAQEVEELIYYVKQRLFLRFNDFFKESFHPGVFNNTSNTNQALFSCLLELINTVQFELVQELQATTLRIEGYIKKAIDEEFLRITHLIKKHSTSIALTKMDHKDIQTPSIKIDFTDAVAEQLKPSLKLFKNTKSFFEKNDKKKMSEDLVHRIDSPISNTLEEYINIFTDYYKEVVNEIHLSLTEGIQVQAVEGFEALLDIQVENTESLKQEQAKLEEVINILKI